MNKTTHHSITIGNKKYAFSLRKMTDGQTYFCCKAANISQPFLNEDITELLFDLPGLIIDEKELSKKRETVIRFRISSEAKKKIEKKALKLGYNSISRYLRDLALKD